MDWSDKVALVTGGGVRMGEAIALALAGRGLKIVLHYASSREAAEKTASAIRSRGGRVELVQADLMQEGQAGRVVAEAANRFGRLDILVNNAGIFEPGGWSDTTNDNWDRQFALNLKAPFFLSQAFGRLNRETGGLIVNIVDGRVRRPDSAHIAYALAKSGLAELTRILAVGLAPRIRVNGVAPGAILPPAGGDPAAWRHIAERIPLQRTGAVEDATRAVLYLLDSDFVTGEVLFVTGGQYL